MHCRSKLRDAESRCAGCLRQGIQNTTADLSAWWRGFEDPVLDRLVAEGLTQNLDVMTAVSRIAQAREQEVIQGAARLPTASATAAAVRVHSDSNPFGQLFGGGGNMSSSSGSGPSGRRSR